MKIVKLIAWILVLVGALNWGLVAFDYNLVSLLVGRWEMVERAVYVLVAISAIYTIVDRKNCVGCDQGTN